MSSRWYKRLPGAGAVYGSRSHETNFGVLLAPEERAMATAARDWLARLLLGDAKSAFSAELMKQAECLSLEAASSASLASRSPRC
jgi:hypothetical protein